MFKRAIKRAKIELGKRGAIEKRSGLSSSPVRGAERGYFDAKLEIAGSKPAAREKKRT